MKTYSGQTLHNVRVTYKLDGVLGIFDGTSWVDKDGEPLYNLPTTYDEIPGPASLPRWLDNPIEPGRYEIFLGDRSKSISAVRMIPNTPNYVDRTIPYECLYRLDDPMDKRLEWDWEQPGYRIKTLEELEVNCYLEVAINEGYEGLVLKADEGTFKVVGKQ